MDLTRYDKLRSAIRRTLSPDEAAAADRALEYAAEHTASQVRHDGSPMLDHAAEVARSTQSSIINIFFISIQFYANSVLINFII